ncbi:MAG: protein kinase [Deltaproteobacteria bacterium]|nr:protein kinase [Deltaproteobacteria bacterium]
MSEDLESRIQALIGAGRHADAAALCLQQGEARRAGKLYAEVWDWPKAIEASENAGYFADAYAYALAAQDRGALQRLMQILPDHPEQARDAAATAEGKGRVVDAASLREAAGEIDLAAELYERAGELAEAARCHESAGRYREAGVLYEKRLREESGDGEAALRLGRILAGFGRWDHAARALQKAVDDRDHREAALEMLVACFDAMKMHDAAGTALERLRRLKPELPVKVDAFLRETFGDERGPAGLSQGDEASQLLAGRYRIVRTLGAGGTGRVLLAHDGFYDREVAVKILTVGSTSQGRDAYVRFEREARVAAGLDHPNVVRVHEFNADGPFLVMEFMAGGTLEERLEEGALPLAMIKNVTNAVLAGLETVHRRGVIHRDLKPANIFFGATGDVKLGDFGTAHLQDLGATLTGALIGTLAYMAPEQVTGSRRPEAATDLYAFGCILYRMLTGALPFPGPDFVTQHLELVPPAPSSLREGLDSGFDALLSRLLGKTIEDRPGSVEEVRKILDGLDWRDPDEDELAALVARERRPEPAPEKRPTSAPPPAAEERYTLLEPREDGAYLAQDELLGRTVRIEPCDPERARFLKKLAAADGPHLQAIFDIDDEGGRAVIEEPKGESMARALMDDDQRARAKTQIREALERLHAAGLVHGHLGLGAVRVGPGRATLLLPAQPSDGSPEADREAFASLFP